MLSVVGDGKQTETVITNVNFFTPNKHVFPLSPTLTDCCLLDVDLQPSRTCPIWAQQADICLLGDSNVLLRLFPQLITLVPQKFVPD